MPAFLASTKANPELTKKLNCLFCDRNCIVNKEHITTWCWECASAGGKNATDREKERLPEWAQYPENKKYTLSGKPKKGYKEIKNETEI